jgi:hypothetical protein
MMPGVEDPLGPEELLYFVPFRLEVAAQQVWRGHLRTRSAVYFE